MTTRAHVVATVPDRGRLTASANVIVAWLPDSTLNDVEEAIKKAAREAIGVVRSRVPATPPAQVAGQLALPLGT